MIYSHSMASVDNGYACSVDVAEYMGYSNPSVSRTVGMLKNGGFVKIAKNVVTTLTPAGHEVAKK